MRSLISPLQSVINALLNGQLVLRLLEGARFRGLVVSPFGDRTTPRLLAFLEQRNVNAVLGHRSRSTYALTHLAPTKRYQRLA